MNIVFLDVKTMGEVPALKNLEKLGNYTSYQLTLPNETITRIAGADIVITCKVVINKEVIDSCPTLKLICVAATGTNNVDVEYARNKGIEVKNVAGYSSESVAQLTVGMALALINKLNYYDNFVKSGAYSKSDMFTHYGPSFFELKGKTLGIIGLGNIGRRVAQLFGVFGMNIIYHSVSGKNTTSDYKHVTLQDLLKESDIISIHCPLTPQTQNLIHSENLNLMKPSSILINMARGGIVNEMDVVEAINTSRLGGFATDVYEKEPMTVDSPFFGIIHPEKVLLTPHIAWTSIEARTLLMEKLIHNIETFQKEKRD